MNGRLFKRDSQPQKILDAVAASRTVHAGGGWSSSYFGFHDRWSPIVAHYIDDDRHPSARLKAVSAILHKRQSWKVNEFADSYRAAIGNIEDAQANYVAVFPLCGKTWLLEALNGTLPRNIKILANLGAVRPRRVAEAHFAQLKDRDHAGELATLLHHQPSSFAVVKVKATSPSHAYAIGRSELEYLLGLLCFGDSRVERSVHISGMSYPGASVLIAPHVTVHNSVGDLATSGYWYTSWRGGPSTGTSDAQRVQATRKNIEALNKGIQRLPWKEKAKMAAVMYFQFLSEPDEAAALLKGWQLLEFVLKNADDMSDSKKERLVGYDQIVSRAARFYKDFEAAEVTGRYIKDVRNSLAHGDIRAVFDERDISWIFEEFARPALQHYFMNPFDLRSIEAFMEFCDAGHSASSIADEVERSKRKTGALKSALKFVSHEAQTRGS